MPRAVDLLGELFRKWSGSDARTILPLPQSGSSRAYYRINGSEKSVIGVYHTDRKENEAFIAFDRHFRKIGIPVPKVYIDELDKNVYLQQDLGDTMLFDLTERSDDFEARELMLSSLEKSVFWLPRLQVAGHKNLDYEKATPRKAFDKQSMMWDLNYFKYHFLKLSGIAFDEQQLEYDFNKLVEYLNQASRNFFLFRDFQSRNIMVRKGEVWFIDFQGGRQGYPAYDIASLLFDAKAGFGPELRNNLFEQYLRNLIRFAKIDEKKFDELRQKSVRDCSNSEPCRH